MKIIDLRSERQFIFCDKELFPLQGVALIEDPDSSITPLISYPIVGEDWRVIGDKYYETLKPSEDGFSDHIFGSLDKPISIKSWPLLHALSFNLQQSGSFDIRETLEQARQYGLDIVNSSPADRSLKLYITQTGAKGIYLITCYDTDLRDKGIFNYPIPSFYISESGLNNDHDFKGNVYSLKTAIYLLSEALRDYTLFFNLPHDLGIDFYHSYNLDRKGKQLLRKLEQQVPHYV